MDILRIRWDKKEIQGKREEGSVHAREGKDSSGRNDCRDALSTGADTRNN